MVLATMKDSKNNKKILSKYKSLDFEALGITDPELMKM